MPKESSIMRMMKNDYLLLKLNMESTYKKTDMLLKLYRKVYWSMDKRFDELNSITYETCMGDCETLTYLLNFAPDNELEVFKSRAVGAMQTKLLIDLIDKAVVRVSEYPDNGGIYYSIIDLKYINYFKYTEDEILEELNLERSTYYRKKKEATVILGYILFGFVMPEYVKIEKSQKNATKMQHNCDPFATDMRF